MPSESQQSDSSPDTPFGISDCDNCGEMDVPILHANDEGFEWCAGCWAIATTGERSS